MVRMNWLAFLSMIALNGGCVDREFNRENSNVFDAAKSPAYWNNFAVHRRSSFARNVNAALDKSADSNTEWGVDARLYGPNGQKIILFSRNNTTKLRPASTLKIFTTWAYFHLFPEVLEEQGAFPELQRMMKESDNAMAEAKMKEAVQKAGSRDKVMKIFTDHGIGDLLLVDGSGLSYDNRATALALTKTLTTLKDGIYYSTFEKLLPIGGVDGTLDHRPLLGEEICGARITAKTGTLIGDPSADMAGFAHFGNGWKLVFTFLGDSTKSVDDGRLSIDTALCLAVRESARFYAKVPLSRQCPASFKHLRVNDAGGTLCSDGINALGPFSEAMRAKCLQWSPGDPVCGQERWAENIAKNAYGSSACPVGTTFEDTTGYCVENGNAFGPFPEPLIAKCKAQNGGTACDSQRWSRAFLSSLLAD